MGIQCNQNITIKTCYVLTNPYIDIRDVTGVKINNDSSGNAVWQVGYTIRYFYDQTQVASNNFITSESRSFNVTNPDVNFIIYAAIYDDLINYLSITDYTSV